MKVQKKFNDFKNVTFALLLVAFPFIIWLIWDKCNIAESTSITADGILTYAGCATTIFVMLHEIRKSIEANKEILEQNEELNAQRRIAEICPKFVFYVSKIEDEFNSYNLEIINISKNAAIDVLIEAFEFKDLLPGGEAFSTTISVGANDNAEIELSDDIRMSENDMPKELILTYKDCDENTANQAFRYVGCSLYDSQKPEYDT